MIGLLLVSGGFVVLWAQVEDVSIASLWDAVRSGGLVGLDDAVQKARGKKKAQTTSAQLTAASDSSGGTQLLASSAPATAQPSPVTPPTTGATGSGVQLV
jgi:hypothetical protein